jgi:hypothetical protein
MLPALGTEWEKGVWTSCFEKERANEFPET